MTSPAQKLLMTAQTVLFQGLSNMMAKKIPTMWYVLR